MEGQTFGLICLEALEPIFVSDISIMEAFLGKWKMDYDACEGYDEFMTAEVNKIAIKCKPRLTHYTHTILQQQCNQVINQQQPTRP